MPQDRNLCRDFVNALTDRRFEFKRKKILIGEEEIGVLGYSTSGDVALDYINPYYYKDKNKTKKYTNDNDKKRDYFKTNNVFYIEFPFYCTFSKEVVKYFLLKPLFDGRKDRLADAMSRNYKTAMTACYKEGKNNPRPGWRGSDHRLHTFSANGIDRFEKELFVLPVATRHQIMDSIQKDKLLNSEIEEKLKNSKNKSQNPKHKSLRKIKKLIDDFEVIKEYIEEIEGYIKDYDYEEYDHIKCDYVR